MKTMLNILGGIVLFLTVNTVVYLDKKLDDLFWEK